MLGDKLRWRKDSPDVHLEGDQETGRHFKILDLHEATSNRGLRSGLCRRLCHFSRVDEA